MNARLGLAAALVGLAFPALAPAQELPCGERSQRAIVLRWRLRPGEQTSWQAHIGAQSGNYQTVSDLTDVQVTDDGIHIGNDGNIWNDREYYIAMTATGPGGRSEFSNEIRVPAEIRVCTPPEPPELIDLQLRVARIEQTLEHIRQALSLEFPLP